MPKEGQVAKRLPRLFVVMALAVWVSACPGGNGSPVEPSPNEPTSGTIIVTYERWIDACRSAGTEWSTRCNWSLNVTVWWKGTAGDNPGQTPNVVMRQTADGQFEAEMMGIPSSKTAGILTIAVSDPWVCSAVGIAYDCSTGRGLTVLKVRLKDGGDSTTFRYDPATNQVIS